MTDFHMRDADSAQFHNNSQNQEHQPSDHKPPPRANVDVFSFDDLLVSAAHEVMVNGIDTTIIPETIKDWLCGKLVRALPKRLTQKLLSFLLDNRDLEGILDYKEQTQGDIPEFTLMIYRTAKSKIRKNKPGYNSYDPHWQPPEKENDKPVNLFNLVDYNEHELETRGVNFFSEELMLDPSQAFIPVKGGIIGKRKNEDDDFGLVIDKKRRTDKKLFEEKFLTKKSKRLPEFADNNTDVSDIDEEIEKDRKSGKVKNLGGRTDNDITQITLDELQHLKEANSTDGEFSDSDSDNETVIRLADQYVDDFQTRWLPNERIQCAMCGKDYQQKSKLQKHQRSVHLSFWKSRAARDTDTTRIEKKLKNCKFYQCHICPKDAKSKNPDSKIRFKTKQKLVKHLHKHHPDKMTLRKLTEEQELAKSFPEAFYDDENKKWSCTLCGFSSRAYYMKRHVEYKHRKAVVATCGVCGKGFTHMQTFREHEYTHTGDYPAVCQYCGKGFKNEYRLREIHKKKHHPQEYEVEKRLLEEEKKKEANMKVLKQGGISISELNL